MLLTATAFVDIENYISLKDDVSAIASMIIKSINLNQKRFEYSDDIKKILSNTAELFNGEK